MKRELLQEQEQQLRETLETRAGPGYSLEVGGPGTEPKNLTLVPISGQCVCTCVCAHTRAFVCTVSLISFGAAKKLLASWWVERGLGSTRNED